MVRQITASCEADLVFKSSAGQSVALLTVCHRLISRQIPLAVLVIYQRLGDGSLPPTTRYTLV